MSWVAFSTWQIALSVVTPALVALLVCLAETRGPLAAPLQKTTGIVAPYFTGIALLFALVTAQMLTEVWQKDNASRLSVQAEDNAIRALMHLARVHGLEATLAPPIKAYIAAAVQENPFSRVGSQPRLATDRAYEALQGVLVGAPGLGEQARGVLLATGVELRQARDRRLYLADEQTAPIKWASVLALGALTQVAIMLVQLGNRRAVRVTVGFFTVAFTFCLVLIAVFDAPFEVSLAHEPGDTLNNTLKTLPP
jgi:hypothetical protein